MDKFKFLEHTADIKFQAFGNTLNEIFENSALAFSNYISGGEKIENRKGKTIEIFGEDYESLLYKFLDELIYLLDIGFVVSKAEVQIRGFNLKAELYGDDTKNYKDLDSVKACTYAEMYIKKVKSKTKDKNNKEEYWESQVVLDV